MEHKDFYSSRLKMLLIKKGYAAQAHLVLQDEALYRYIPKSAPSLADLERTFGFWENRDSPDKSEYWLNWIVCTQDTGACIGRVQIGIHKEKKVGDIAYMIGSASQGKGYGTEAVRALLNHCQEVYGVSCFKAWIDTRNAASIRLVEKVGMHEIEFIEKADHFDGEDSDEYVYQLMV